MNIILLGPPGSGKGTQARWLQQKLGVPSISTGEIFRVACTKQTPLGKLAQQYLSQGQLVPDQTVVEIVRIRLSQEDCTKGALLDGFPRTLNQAEAYDAFLQEREQVLDGVLNFEVEDAELIQRLSGRRICSSCGASFHLSFAPPKADGSCDHCTGKLLQRDDDVAETVLKRLQVYRAQTAPLIEYYGKKKLIRNIKAQGEASEIFSKICGYLGLPESIEELDTHDYIKVRARN